MESISTLEIDPTYLKDLRETLLVDYRLIMRLISETNRSFERALSVCLFGNEDEVESISDTLKSHCDWYSGYTSVSDLLL